MATSGGPYIKRNGLVFGYDTGKNPSTGFDHRVTKRRFFKGKPTTNFFSDGHFPNGTDMASEAGSNSQNDIIQLKNPGDSKYVLRQTMGVASTEYQINLSTQLSANTTYCLSGWYAESSDYSGASRMFHCRAYSSGGSHTSLGTGLYNVLKTKVVGGITWKHCYATITTPADYSNSFNWYVGYAGDSYSGARYYTNLKMEQGSYPTPYKAGTRSSTESLIDLTHDTTIDLSNVSFDSNGQLIFDGTDDYISIDSVSSDIAGGDFTLEAIIKGGTQDHKSIISINTSSGGNRGLWMVRNAGMGFHDGGNWYVGTIDVDDNTYHHVILTYDHSTKNARTYTDGVSDLNITTANQVTVASNDKMSVGMELDSSSPSDLFNGEIPVAKVYNRILSPREVKQNFKAYKNRFNI